MKYTMNIKNASVLMYIQHMSTDVKELEDLRKAASSFKSKLKNDGDVQVVDALIAIIDEELRLLESDD